MTTRIVPNPEMLTRRDGANPTGGAWTVDECAPVRGEPHVIISQRRMTVPTRDEPIARVIRAHEMMHVKVSPPDYTPWMNRGIASLDSLQAAEELRVNLLLGRAGFDTKLLADGGEEAEGEYAAANNEWAAAVRTTVAYAATGSLKPFLTGIRRHNREWGQVLRSIADRAEKMLAKVDAGTLGFTGPGPSGMPAPYGFAHTERLAEWIDRLARDDRDSGDGSGGGSGSAPGAGDGAHGDEAQAPKPPPVSVEYVKAAKADLTPSSWRPVAVERVPLPRVAPGGLGRKRRPSQFGRSPRRVHRILTDPERRIFDATTRGNGGVVLIDASGSMALSHDDILAICEAAPGATVAMHACGGAHWEANLWVLADRGRVAAEIPPHPHGNGNDGTALRWAIDQRQHSRAPVLWITDGGVQGADGQYHDGLAMDCIRTVVDHDCHIVPNTTKAIEVLKTLRQGQRPKRWWPYPFVDTHDRLTGRGIPPG